MKKETNLSKCFKQIGLLDVLMIGTSSNLYMAEWKKTFIEYR